MRAGAFEQVDNIKLRIEARALQWRLSRVVGDVRICVMRQEQVHHIFLVCDDGQQQRCSPLLVNLIRIRTFIKQRADAHDISGDDARA